MRSRRPLIRILHLIIISLGVILLGGTTLQAGELPEGMGWHQAAAVELSNTANYEWYYGCSPTAAGMMMGHYDRNGYLGQSFANLVPGGVAEATTFGVTGPLVNSIIASQGHIDDFYSAGTGGSGDDTTGPVHAFNSLADFMGTSQDSAYNANGETYFYYWNDGSPLTTIDLEFNGIQDEDGMYGIGEYVNYAGYDFDGLYTQLIDAEATLGFTYSQYQAEIDAGRPVMVHLDGHTMFGYGYDASQGQVYVYDTFAPDGQTPGNMTWGGSYDGMAQWGVTGG